MIELDPNPTLIRAVDPYYRLDVPHGTCPRNNPIICGHKPTPEITDFGKSPFREKPESFIKPETEIFPLSTMVDMFYKMFCSSNQMNHRG